ncbi:UNKNOWN [Stylonychia lemnae]|uniref:Timeless N-terminal domain-containing protein n=1 Tax=Stylonychia lemnae TaxID=5949 RepID=A0A078AGZ8_STYLE|nr:UNKNOWN [Stylonychia lemnae]|eukprot:CDW80133.1 UNKNOWN [Stylonychia lemnae]
MTDTAKQQFDPRLYDEEEDDYEDDNGVQANIERNNNEYGLGDNDMDDIENVEAKMDEEEQNRLFKELLFCVQGVGSVKNINGYDVYVKNESYCEDSLKDLYSNLKRDGDTYPIVRLFLGEWGLLKKDLLPLLVFHKQDKRLSFLTTMIMVQLTALPGETCQQKQKYMSYLREYKQAFLQPNVISVLMEHLADCLQKEERNQKHEQMIELIIVLFKQLLVIPDDKKKDQSNFVNLQKSLLIAFAEESVLDSFIFMTQDFSHSFFQKLSIHFMEIWYQIFKSFTPQQIFNFEEGEKQALQDIDALEKARMNRQNFLRGIRHSKFGSQLQVFRNDGSSVIVGNIYQKNIEVNEVKNGQKRRAQSRMIKDQKHIIEAPQTGKLVNEGALEQSDRKLLQMLRNHLTDMLQNSYCPLIEQIFNELAKSGEAVEEFDKFHYFKLQTFMMQICRLQAYEKHKLDKSIKMKEIQQQQAEEDKKNLFNLSKSKQRKLPIPKVPFNIDISQIGASLQLNNFDYLYSTLYTEIQKKKKLEMKFKDFHSALQLLTQFLYIIRDMATSEDEKNKKNSQILLSNVFHHELVKIAHTGIRLYDEKLHHKQFLHDSIEFTHLMMSMLDEYSKGKVLTIQTQKIKKVKKSKKSRKAKIFGEVDQADLERMKRQNEEDMDDDYNPNNKEEDIEKDIDNLANQDDMYDNVMDNLSDEEDSDEDDGQSRYVERKLNFAAEISLLVDYDTLSKYVMVLRDKDYQKNPQLLQAITSWFKRIVHQLKATWIFFQLEYLICFEQVLSEGQINNNLMKGFGVDRPVTTKDKQIDSYLSELKPLLMQIVKQFMETLQINSLLGIECLFRFSSREVKDAILDNYDKYNGDSNQAKRSEDQEMEDIYGQQKNETKENRDEAKQKQRSAYDENDNIQQQAKNVWTEEQDNILIDNYDQFKALGSKMCVEFLAQLLDNKTPRECYERIKALGLKDKGAQEAKQQSRLLNQQQNESLNTAKIAISVKQFLMQKIGTRVSMDQLELKKYLEFIMEIEKGYLEFKQQEEEMLLFGKVDEVYDLQRNFPDFTVVPVNKEQFDMINEKPFTDLLAALDIRQPKYGQLYLKIQTNLQKEIFSRNIEQLFSALTSMRNAQNVFDKESVNQQTIIIKAENDEMQNSEEEIRDKNRKDKKKKSKHDKKNKKHKKHRKYEDDDDQEQHENKKSRKIKKIYEEEGEDVNQNEDEEENEIEEDKELEDLDQLYEGKDNLDNDREEDQDFE